MSNAVLVVTPAQGRTGIALDTGQHHRLQLESRNGYLYVQLCSAFHYPIPDVQCTVRALRAPRVFPQRTTNQDGVVEWNRVPLDDYMLELRTPAGETSIWVPWLADHAVHRQMIRDPSKLIGTAASDIGRQFRLKGLGYYHGPIISQDAPDLDEALRRFQAATTTAHPGAVLAGGETTAMSIAQFFGG